MNALKTINRFFKNEFGAVTVDWIVLTAALVGLGIAVVTSIRAETTDLGGHASNQASETVATEN